jgi:hypothetical protein
MKASLTPEKVLKDLSLAEINKEEAGDLLISLIEKSDKANIRVKSINILEQLSLLNEKIFQVLENCLLSDEDAAVRASAVKLMLLNFTDVAIAPIKWSIEHDKSPLVLKIIFDYFENIKNHKFESIIKFISNWFKEFSSQIGIVSEESRFFFDLDYLFAKDKRNYEINPRIYKTFEKVRDDKESEPWLVINNRHVEILNFNYFTWNFIKEHTDLIESLIKMPYLNLFFNAINKYNYNRDITIEIPKSIGRLILLKKLVLKGNFLKKIPPSIKKLSHLKELDLSYNQFQDIPIYISSLNSLEFLNLKHNKIDEISHPLGKTLNFIRRLEY